MCPQPAHHTDTSKLSARLLPVAPISLHNLPAIRSPHRHSRTTKTTTTSACHPSFLTHPRPPLPGYPSFIWNKLYSYHLPTTTMSENLTPNALRKNPLTPLSRSPEIPHPQHLKPPAHHQHTHVHSAQPRNTTPRPISHTKQLQLEMDQGQDGPFPSSSHIRLKFYPRRSLEGEHITIIKEDVFWRFMKEF